MELIALQIIDISTEVDGIIINPSNEFDEIMQNVRTIITTVKGSVPLDRDFGIDPSILDSPTTVIESKLTSAVIEAVERYEPRVKVMGISFDGDAEDGIITPKVKVMIK